MAADGECEEPELTCAVVLCAAPECETNECASYDYDDSGLACCPQCCTESCVNCLVNPCDGYYCASDPTLECQANYCGGCNRVWYSSERSGMVQCEEEGLVSERIAIKNPLGAVASSFSTANDDGNLLDFDDSSPSASLIPIFPIVLAILVMLY